jgi:hypothetical protein
MTARIAITSSLILAAMLLLQSSIASAEVTGACLSDVKALCPGAQPGADQIKACLRSHLKDLSEPCQAVVLKAINVQACAADVKRICGDTQPGEGRVEACMKTRIDDLSDACEVAMANAAAGQD